MAKGLFFDMDSTFVKFVNTLDLFLLHMRNTRGQRPYKATAYGSICMRFFIVIMSNNETVSNVGLCTLF